jgi:hypothetical protein
MIARLSFVRPWVREAELTFAQLYDRARALAR